MQCVPESRKRINSQICNFGWWIPETSELAAKSYGFHFTFYDSPVPTFTIWPGFPDGPGNFWATFCDVYCTHLASNRSAPQAWIEASFQGAHSEPRVQKLAIRVSNKYFNQQHAQQKVKSPKYLFNMDGLMSSATELELQSILSRRVSGHKDPIWRDEARCNLVVNLIIFQHERKECEGKKMR